MVYLMVRAKEEEV